MMLQARGRILSQRNHPYRALRPRGGRSDGDRSDSPISNYASYVQRLNLTPSPVQRASTPNSEEAEQSFETTTEYEADVFSDISSISTRSASTSPMTSPPTTPPPPSEWPTSPSVLNLTPGLLNASLERRGPRTPSPPPPPSQPSTPLSRPPLQAPWAPRAPRVARPTVPIGSEEWYQIPSAERSRIYAEYGFAVDLDDTVEFNQEEEVANQAADVIVIEDEQMDSPIIIVDDDDIVEQNAQPLDDVLMEAQRGLDLVQVEVQSDERVNGDAAEECAKCPACWENLVLVRESRFLVCGHVLCSECLHKVYRRSETRKCVVCRAPIQRLSDCRRIYF